MIKVKSHYRKRKFVRTHSRKERTDRGKRNRARGLRFEFAVLAKAKRTHSTVFRSAGSRGDFDVIIEEPRKMRYQIVKANGYVPPNERNDLEKYIKTKPNFVQLELVYRKHKKDMSKFIMSPAGSKKIIYLDRTKFKKSFSSAPHTSYNIPVILDMVP